MESRCPIVIDRTGKDIHAEAARIRARGPVAEVELPGGVRGWSIVGYEQARHALADHRFSKDPRRHWTAYVDGEIGEDFPLIGWVLMENLTTTYGNDHRRLRRLTSNAFTPRRVEAMRSSIEKITADLLDDLAGGAPGERARKSPAHVHAGLRRGRAPGGPDRARALPGSAPRGGARR